MDHFGTLIHTSAAFSTHPSLTRVTFSTVTFQQSSTSSSFSPSYSFSLSSNPNSSKKRPNSNNNSRWKRSLNTEASGSILENKVANSNLSLTVMENSGVKNASSVSDSSVKSKPGLGSSKIALVAAVKVIPHPDKVEKGGEDAFFFQTHEDPVVLCVADGVGGWASDGIDPSLYSREFVKHAQEAVETSEIAMADPRSILQTAYEKTLSPGATTAIVATLGGQRKLRIACLGDSGLRIVRQGKVVFGTPPHQHYFDCPFQFGSESPDTASDAQVYEVDLEEGDTIVVASDGLYDNVYDRDIGAVVSVFGGSDVSTAEHTAAALAALASKHSGDRAYDSPYSQEAIAQGQDLPLWQKLLGRKLTGGKPDDITVVVAHVVPSRENDDARELREGELDGIVAAV